MISKNTFQKIAQQVSKYDKIISRLDSLGKSSKETREALAKLEKIKTERPSFYSHIPQGLAIGAGLITAGKLADLIINALSRMYVNSKSKEYYVKMLEANPQLQSVDPKELAKYWASLYHFSPYMAEDPLAAGAYITQSLKRLSGTEFGGPPPETFATLAGIEKAKVDTIRNNFNPGTDVSKEYIRSFTNALTTNAVTD